MPLISLVVIIEGIEEDEKTIIVEVHKGSKKKQYRENDDESQLQHAVRNPPTKSLESEDDNVFPVSFFESKKSSESVSYKKGKKNKEISNEDRKIKSGTISDLNDSSGYNFAPGFFLFHGIVRCSIIL